MTTSKFILAHKSRSFFIAILCSVILSFSFQANAKVTPENTKILAKARKCYCNLKARGLKGFQASLYMNFALMLKNVLEKADTAQGDSILTILNSVHYRINFDSLGRVTYNHTSINPYDLLDTTKVFQGLEESVSGFFMVWNQLMFNPLFPNPDSEYHIQKKKTGYAFKTVEFGANTEYDLDKNFMITAMKIESSSTKVTMNLEFASTKTGFLLTRVKQNIAGVIELDMPIKYSLEKSFPLPSEVKASGAYMGIPIESEFGFTDYRVIQETAIHPLEDELKMKKL